MHQEFTYLTQKTLLESSVGWCCKTMPYDCSLVMKMGVLSLDLIPTDIGGGAEDSTWSPSCETVVTNSTKVYLPCGRLSRIRDIRPLINYNSRRRSLKCPIKRPPDAALQQRRTYVEMRKHQMLTIDAHGCPNLYFYVRIIAYLLCSKAIVAAIQSTAIYNRI